MSGPSRKKKGKRKAPSDSEDGTSFNTTNFVGLSGIGEGPRLSPWARGKAASTSGASSVVQPSQSVAAGGSGRVADNQVAEIEDEKESDIEKDSDEEDEDDGEKEDAKANNTVVSGTYLPSVATEITIEAIATETIRTDATISEDMVSTHTADDQRRRSWPEGQLGMRFVQKES